MMETKPQPSVAVLIPCYNEAATIGKVVEGFRRELAKASIYVFDNCSTDETGTVAAEHGAIVVKEPRRGKDFLIDGMFDRVEADAYVMVDGDDTYPAERACPLEAGSGWWCGHDRWRPAAFAELAIVGNVQCHEQEA